MIYLYLTCHNNCECNKINYFHIKNYSTEFFMRSHCDICICRIFPSTLPTKVLYHQIENKTILFSDRNIAFIMQYITKLQLLHIDYSLSMVNFLNFFEKIKCIEYMYNILTLAVVTFFSYISVFLDSY